MNSGYKANLLQNAKYQVGQTGGKVTVRREHVRFTRKDGQSCVVWYPVDSRVKDLEIVDMKEAILWASGKPAFVL